MSAYLTNLHAASMYCATLLVQKIKRRPSCFYFRGNLTERQERLQTEFSLLWGNKNVKLVLKAPAIFAGTEIQAFETMLCREGQALLTLGQALGGTKAQEAREATKTKK